MSPLVATLEVADPCFRSSRSGCSDASKCSWTRDPVPADAWAERRATDPVKLLALAPGHRMARDEALEMLWPKLGADGAASNLHNAASYARRALGDRDAVVLRGGVVEHAPAAEVSTDVERFERGEDSAHGGEPLPTSP